MADGCIDGVDEGLLDGELVGADVDGIIDTEGAADGAMEGKEVNGGALGATARAFFKRTAHNRTVIATLFLFIVSDCIFLDQQQKMDFF